jgi:hypothetical protein
VEGASSAISRERSFAEIVNAVRLGVRRQQRPVDEVANLSALIEGEWVRGHRERSWGAVSCAAVAKLRGARALEESFKASKLSEAQF